MTHPDMCFACHMLHNKNRRPIHAAVRTQSECLGVPSPLGLQDCQSVGGGAREVNGAAVLWHSHSSRLGLVSEMGPVTSTRPASTRPVERDPNRIGPTRLTSGGTRVKGSMLKAAFSHHMAMIMAVVLIGKRGEKTHVLTPKTGVTQVLGI